MVSMRAESCPDFARNSQKSPQFMCLAPSTHWMAEIGRLISVALNALVGAIPSAGEVQFDGERMRSFDLEQRVAAGIALVPESRALFGDLTVLDNLRLGAYRFMGQRSSVRPEDHLTRVFDLFPRLRERRGQLARTLSGGERQMLAIGRALM